MTDQRVGSGRIAKVSLDGKIIENRFLPDTGDVLNKPKGLWPAKDGSLLIVGFKSDKEARGIFALTAKGEVKKLSKDIGRLDGLYQMRDGTLLATDWNTGFWFPSAFSVRSVVKAFRF